MTSTTKAKATPADASGALTHREIVTILIGLMMGMFLAALDQTIVTTAMRTIADDLQGFVPAGVGDHRLPDHLDDLDPAVRQAVRHLRSQAVLPVRDRRSSSSALPLCGLADSMYQLAAFRALQGIGAGGLMSLALAIIGDIVPPRERAKYQGYFLAVFGTSSVLGPGAGRLLRRRGHHSRRRRLALDLLHQRADRARRDGRGCQVSCTSRTPARTTASTGPARWPSSSAWCRC